MEGSIVLHLYVLGLVALVPNSATSPTGGTLYVVDARSAPFPHTPIIGFPVTRESECPMPPPTCDLFDGFCICKLDAGEIRLRRPPIENLAHLPLKPGAAQPGDESEEDDVEWLMEMGNANSSASKVKPNLTRDIVASMSFSWKSARVCKLATVSDDQGRSYVASYEFLPRNGPSFYQSLAEVVRFDVELPFKPIVLDIPTLGIVQVPCGSNNIGCHLIIGNSRRPDPCDNGVNGLDFDHYYGLSSAQDPERILPKNGKPTKFTKTDLCPAPAHDLQEAVGLFIVRYGPKSPLSCDVMRLLALDLALTPFQFDGEVVRRLLNLSSNADGRPICPVVVMNQ